MGCQLPTCRSQDPSDCDGCEHKFEVQKMECAQCGTVTLHAVRENKFPTCMVCGKKDSKDVLFPTLTVKCKNDHEWGVLISPWYFNIEEVGRECPVCKCKAEAAKWGGMQPLTK